MRIVFVHNRAAEYRVPFFVKVAELYDIVFLLTHTKQAEGMSGAKYEVLRNYLGFAPGLIPRLMTMNYGLVVNGVPPGLPGIIELMAVFAIAKLRGKAYIQWSEDWDSPKKSLRFKLFLVLLGFITSRSDACLVPGIRHRQLLLSLGVKSQRIFIMPNASTLGITQEDYVEADKIRTKLGKDRVVILFVGRLIEQKGVHYLLQAFHRLRENIEGIALVIVGSGPWEQKLRLMSKKYGIEDAVHFIGFVPRRRLAPYYLLSDLVVVPSVCVHAGDRWVLVVNEALWFRKPVVATTAVGSAYDLVRDGVNGYIVPEKDPEALCQAMRGIISDAELRARMGLESRRIAESSFTYDHMAEVFREAIDSIKAKSRI